VDGKVRSLDGQLREVSRRQEALARAASSPATSAEGYVVRRGDTLSKIAAQFGVTVAALKSHNSLTDDLIREGQTLAIPAP
jgi:LysM repeat protein